MIPLPYDHALVRQIASTLDLRAPNLDALDATAKALDGARDGAELVLDLATGVGKTYIAGGLLDYLQEQGVRNVVIVTPGSAIQRKTIGNLTRGHPKYIRGLQCRPVIVTLDDVETGVVGQALRNENVFKVFVLTVQSLLRPNSRDNRRAHRPHEMLGEAMTEYLSLCDDLVVIADEHHTYFGATARRFRQAIEQLRPRALVGLTATPHEVSEKNVIYRYPLAEAIADGYVKIPVLVARPDNVSDIRTQLADGLALLDAKASAMQAYSTAVQQEAVRPVMFVVAETIEEASRIRDMLAGPEMLGDGDKVLLVTSDQPDDVMQQLDTLEDPSSAVRVVVSVSMLKEGWDVKNIYVIAAVRALESSLLTEQILGRGLRLPFGRRTGVGMLDTVEVLSHHRFRDLLAQAESLLLQTLGDRAAEAEAVAVPTPGVHGSTYKIGQAERAADDSGVQDVLFALPGVSRAEVDPATTEVPHAEQASLIALDELDATTHQVGGVGTLESRLQAGGADSSALSQQVRPQPQPGVNIPLFLPRVSVRLERNQFSLSTISPVDVEALGRKFSDDNSPSLTRKALEARREAGTVHVEISDRTSESVLATQERMPFDSIEGDLVQRLMASNAVASTTAEMNAAIGIARSFLTGALVTEETPWRAEHGRLATTALVEWIGRKQKSMPVRHVAEVTQVKWPEPPEVTFSAAPTDRNRIARASEFVRGHPYMGWSRGVYRTYTFDAYSTEFRLAEIFDSSGGQIRAFTRINQAVPLVISYQSGAGVRSYVPDFLVIDNEGTHWVVEGKRDDEMLSDNVQAKRDAAADWVRTVNTSGNVQDTWSYMLASESVIRDSSTFATLKTAAQTYR